MCLLFLVPDRANREAVDDAWLTDIYTRNDDGFGFMWHTKSGGPQHYKAVGPVADFIAAYRRMEGHAKPFAVHVRMATHGDVETSQSHPYTLDDDGSAWLMHNGILSTGNFADRSKSDTWHYINDTVGPLYAALGDGLFTPALLDMMGEAIGSNRFILMDKHGGFHTVNKNQGLIWRGMWLSNTYAWSAVKYGAVKPAPTTYGSWAGSKGSGKGKGKGAGKGVGKALATLDDSTDAWEYDWPYGSELYSRSLVPGTHESMNSASTGRYYGYRDAADWLDSLADTELGGAAETLYASRVMDYVRKHKHAERVLNDLLYYSDADVFEDQDVLDIVLKNQYRGIEINEEQWDTDIIALDYELDQGITAQQEMELFDEDDTPVAIIDADADLTREINEALGEPVLARRRINGGH